MIGRRKLPVSVVPRSGEVLESWLGTLASRLDLTFGALLRAIGSSSDGVDLRRKGISIRLTEPEVAALAVSTDASPDQLCAMTMARYDGHLVSIDRSGSRWQWSTWYTTRTRFCPACLIDSGGRWQLRWRLPWVFVCDTHGCLLEDTCSLCGQEQRVSPFWLPRKHIPDLQRCSSWVGGEDKRLWCRNELSTNVFPSLAVDDPLAQAYTQLSGILAQRVTTFGVYALSPASSLRVLADLRVLSARLLAAVALEDVDDFLGANRCCSLRARVAASSTSLGERWGSSGALSAHAPALITGIGIALALKVLEAESVDEAGDRLRTFVGWRLARDGRRPTPAILEGGHVSPALEAVYLSAVSVHLLPSSKLRYRTMTEFPRYPGGDDAGRLDAAVRSIPTALWREWGVRLFPTSYPYLDAVSPSLSALLLIVGTRVTVDDAYRRIGWEGRRPCRIAVLDYFYRNPLWLNIATAVVRLHAYLLADPSPIDYQRRRSLDYSDLLPADQWTNICQRVDLSRADSDTFLQIARAWLFERVSGRPAATCPFISGNAVSQPERDQFVERFTSELVTALDREAEHFLHAHSIFDEPVWWVPPLSIVGDLELPGPDPGTISIPELHLAMKVKAMTVLAAAQHFGVGTSLIRLLLERHPEEGKARQERRARLPTQLEQLRSSLPRHELFRLHHDEGLSVRIIAAHFGVRSNVVRALASEYNVDTRRGTPRPRPDIDPAWFRRECIENGRSQRDIADETGASRAALHAFALQLGIPIPRYPRRRRRPGYRRT